MTVERQCQAQSSVLNFFPNASVLDAAHDDVPQTSVALCEDGGVGVSELIDSLT